MKKNIFNLIKLSQFAKQTPTTGESEAQTIIENRKAQVRKQMGENNPQLNQQQQQLNQIQQQTNAAVAQMEQQTKKQLQSIQLDLTKKQKNLTELKNMQKNITAGLRAAQENGDQKKLAEYSKLAQRVNKNIKAYEERILLLTNQAKNLKSQLSQFAQKTPTQKTPTEVTPRSNKKNYESIGSRFYDLLNPKQ